jgi:hypothetical protein
MEWPTEPFLRIRTEQRALEIATPMATARLAAWDLVPPSVREDMIEIVRAFEAHWPDPATRPPEVDAAIWAFREG